MNPTFNYTIGISSTDLNKVETIVKTVNPARFFSYEKKNNPIFKSQIFYTASVKDTNSEEDVQKVLDELQKQAYNFNVTVTSNLNGVVETKKFRKLKNRLIAN